MSRPRNLVPSYLLHRKTGRGRAVWTDAAGIRHERLLPGPFNSDESRAAFARLQLEIESSPGRMLRSETADISVNEVMAAYLDHADRHYRGPDGNPTGETERIRAAIRHVREMYGETPAAEFGPLALKAIRAKYVSAGWCRRSVNQQVERVRRAFKWAASEELVPVSVHQALTTVTGLQRGRTDAREMEPVGPVDDAVVDATLAHLNRHVRGLVQFQRLTGCRPGEACRVRRCDIDMGGEVWLYRPPHHKNSHRGLSRTVAIGPQAQAVLREFFTPNIDDYLFSPARAVDEIRAERAAKRVTPRYPSHMRRNAAKRKAKPARKPADRYTTRSYSVAVDRACEKANVPHWHPNQLRHSFATRVRKQHGLEAAQVLLGHARADVTQVYAERNEQLAVNIAAMCG